MDTRPSPPNLDDQAAQLIAAVNNAMTTPTHYRDHTPLPTTGTTPPVTQPGRPPMSQRATDTSALLLSGSVLTLAAGGAISGILWASGHADPTTIALIAAAPISIAVPILALSRLMARAKDAAAALPTEQHHHYNAPVTQDQRTINTRTSGMWASTRNQMSDSD
ncbi:hypothetical protein [Streptomyces cinereoruber]|uniref:hypothetical protein n=1 Tax=Streptomyces cinereoruber TaxID=67260 RepID=UPI00363A9067